MADYKIIFTGPVGAGKTTAIGVLSDEPTVVTDQKASDMTTNRKEQTTVAMDWGVMHLGDEQHLHLYGTPGQERFDFMWDILTRGGLGLVLLIDNSRVAPFRDLHFFLHTFKDFIARTAVTVGVTRMDEQPAPVLDDYYREITRLGWPTLPVLEVDAREKADVYLLVQSLLYSLDPTLAD